MLQDIHVTSKVSLKMQCLYIAKGKVKEAQELYDFLSKDMESLPDFEPVQPTFMDNTKNTVNGVLAWIKENKDTLSEGFDFVRSLMQKKAPLPPKPLPPID